MLDPVDVAAILVVAGFSIIVNRYLKRRTMLMVTPPGPACWPIIGNMFEISQTEPWKTYWAWSQIYKSSLISVRIPGQLMIVLNTAEAAQDLLSQRARNYSDKPRLAMMELEEWDWSTGFLPYGNRWQKHRRFLHQSLHQNALATFYPAQNLHLRRFALRLHSNPAQFRAHIRQFTAGLFISIAYGIDVAEDPYLAQLSEQAVEMMATSNFPGAQLLNAVPALRHLPAWFPGAGFKRFALKCRALTRKLRFEPLGVVKQATANGSARPSVASALLERAGKSDLSEDDAAEIAGIIYAAGSDTLAAALTTVIAISALRPDIQRRACAQLDSVLGGVRLPDQSDRKSLPYIEAICREILRWHMITPLGLPHASIDDDWYEGMYIPGVQDICERSSEKSGLSEAGHELLSKNLKGLPNPCIDFVKGTTIFLNAWAISRNPTAYPEPEVFRPERFLDEDGNLTGLEENAVFGYGRRECVGKHLAMSTLFLAVAYLLTVFEFGKAKDEHGQDIDIREEFEGVLISYPVEFQCDIRPRDEQAIELLKTLDLADA